jgi:hypothetical protein
VRYGADELVLELFDLFDMGLRKRNDPPVRVVAPPQRKLGYPHGARAAVGIAIDLNDFRCKKRFNGEQLVEKFAAYVCR